MHARTRTGGICVPYSPQAGDIIGLLILIASVILVVVLMGAAAIGFFKVLMSVRLRLSWRWLKLSDREILGGRIRPTAPICRRFPPADVSRKLLSLFHTCMSN